MLSSASSTVGLVLSDDQDLREDLSTGLGAIDSLTGGLGRGQLWLVVGEDGIGKTNFLLGLCAAVALDARQSALFLAGVVDARQLGMSLAASRTGIPRNKLRTRDLDEQQQHRLEEFHSSLAEAQLDFDTAPYLPSNLATIFEHWSGRTPRLLVIDDADVWQPDPAILLPLLSNIAAENWITVVATVPPDFAVTNDRPTFQSRRTADTVLRLRAPESAHRWNGIILAETIHRRNGRLGSDKLLSQNHLGRFIDP